MRRARGDDAPWSFVAWKPVAENPVFTGTGTQTWDRKIRERGYILVGDDGTFHLWYTGYDQDKPATMSLGHATSRDGTHWNRDPNNPIFSGSWVEDMCVVKQNGSFQMFAEGKNDIAHRLTSTDGLHWTDQGSLDIRKTDGTPIPPGPYGTPAAWFENGVWYLFYERGDQGIWLATSRDLKTWTNLKDDPVIARGPESYDAAAVALNQIVKRDGYYYAFYHANAATPMERLDDRSRPLQRPRPLGKVSGQPDHQEQLLERRSRHHPQRRPALHDAPGCEGVRTCTRREVELRGRDQR